MHDNDFDYMKPSSMGMKTECSIGIINNVKYPAKNDS